MTEEASDVIGDPDNDVLVNVITLWEIPIKRAIGKLLAPIDLRVDVSNAGFETLMLTADHIVAAELLLLFHRGSFDRALIAQAQQEGAARFSILEVRRSANSSVIKSF